MQIRLADDMAEVGRAIDRVEQLLQQAGAEPGVVLKVSLCLDELLTNVVSYGFVDGGRHEIELRVAVADGAVRIEVEDDGRPFNPLDHPAPRLDAPPEQRERGGLGIHIVRQTMDRVAYRRTGGRNLLTMQRGLRGDAGPQRE